MLDPNASPSLYHLLPSRVRARACSANIKSCQCRPPRRLACAVDGPRQKLRGNAVRGAVGRRHGGTLLEGEQECKCEAKSIVDLDARGSWAKPRGTPVMAVPRFSAGRRSSTHVARHFVKQSSRPTHSSPPHSGTRIGTVVSAHASINRILICGLSRNTNTSETRATPYGACVHHRAAAQASRSANIVTCARPVNSRVARSRVELD